MAASEAVAQTFSVKKVFLKLMNHNISNVGNPTLLYPPKSIEKNADSLDLKILPNLHENTCTNTPKPPLFIPISSKVCNSCFK